TREELAAIKEQAAAEYPNECCGVILVRGAERRHVPCRNVQDQMHARDPITFPRTARNAYYMDPIDALRLNRLADEGFAFAVIYHSHPNAGAYFSETDRGQALIKGEPAYPRAALGRRRTRVPRLRRLVGAARARPRAARGGGGGDGGGGGRDELRRAHATGGRARRGDRDRVSVDGAGAARLLGDGGGHERHSRRAGRHRPRPPRQV